MAALIATFAAFELYRIYVTLPGEHTDFKIVWLGARAILEGLDPYQSTGIGKLYPFPFPQLYPATAFVAVLPFGLLSEHAATLVFVWLSTFLLAYGVTSKGWYLLPIFASEVFFSAAHLAQWSIIFTAALFLPWLQAIVAVKPQTGIAIMAGSPSRKGFALAAVSGIVLLALSLALVPGWPLEWLPLVRDAKNLRAPVTLLGGPLALLVVMRWRRPEAWMILAMLLIPHNTAWYDTLPLLTVACSFRQSATLAIISTLGIMAGRFTPGTPDAFAAMLVATAYLPPVILVLTRPNEGPVFAWPRLPMRAT